MFKHISLFALYCLISVVLGSINICLYKKNEEKDKVIEDVIEKIINNGSIFVDVYDFYVTHPAIRAGGSVSNMTIGQLDQYDLKIMKWYDVFEKRFQIFNLTFYNVSFIGNYDITGNVGELFDIFGVGPFWLSLVNFTITATGSLTRTNAGICIPTDVDVSLGAVENNFHNFMGDAELEVLMNDAFTSIGAKAVEIAWQDVVAMNSPRWEHWINWIINNRTHH